MLVSAPGEFCSNWPDSINWPIYCRSPSGDLPQARM